MRLFPLFKAGCPARARVRKSGLAAAVLALGATTGLAASGFAVAKDDDPQLLAEVRAALKLRLPKTPIDSLICDGLGGLCEVTSKSTLFYVDRQARFLIVGRLYDMETRQDLTAARLLALNPDLLAAGGLRREADDTRATPARASAAAKVPLAGLTPEGAVRWGPSDGPRIIVFSDFHCSYCKRLSAELVKLGARVEERPISILGADSRKLAEKVLCANDPARAVHLAYAGADVPANRACDTKGLDANEAFAKAHGFAGTPVIVRPSDGAVLEGYRPVDQLAAFLKAASPKPETVQ
jgi:thiol:disulfide interchange protein DsbC